MDKFGPTAFNRGLNFDEMATLHQVQDYMQKTLGCLSVIIKSTEEAKGMEEKVAELSVPGEPGILLVNTDE